MTRNRYGLFLIILVMIFYWGCATDRATRKKTEQIDTIQTCNECLAKDPDRRFAKLTHKILNDERMWPKAKKTNGFKGYADYLSLHPNPLFLNETELAQKKPYKIKSDENQKLRLTALSFEYNHVLYSSENLDAGKGFTVTASKGKTKVGVSSKNTLARSGGQEYYKLTLYAGSLEREIPLHKDVNLLIGLTYNKPRKSLCPSYKEASYLEMGEIIGYHQFPPPPGYAYWVWKHKIKGGIGAHIGINATLWKITKNLDLQLGVTYHWLRLEEIIECHFGNGAWYQTFVYRNFSGPNASLRLKKRF